MENMKRFPPFYFVTGDVVKDSRETARTYSRGGSKLVPQVPMNLSTFDKKVKKNIPV